MNDLVDALYWRPWAALTTLEPWWFYLFMALYLMAKLSFGGWVLAKAGRGPLWVLLLLVPGVEIVALWAFAYVRWPFVDRPR